LRITEPFVGLVDIFSLKPVMFSFSGNVFFNLNDFRYFRYSGAGARAGDKILAKLMSSTFKNCLINF